MLVGLNWTDQSYTVPGQKNYTVEYYSLHFMYPIIHQHSDTSSFLINRSGSFQSNLTAYITPTSPYSPANPPHTDRPHAQSPLPPFHRSSPHSSTAQPSPQLVATAAADRSSLVTNVTPGSSSSPRILRSPPRRLLTCLLRPRGSLPSASPMTAMSSISSSPPPELLHRSAPPEQMLCRWSRSWGGCQVSAGYGCQESSCARGNDEGCCAFGDDDEIREWRHGVQPRDLPCSGKCRLGSKLKQLILSATIWFWMLI